MSFRKFSSMFNRSASIDSTASGSDSESSAMEIELKDFSGRSLSTSPTDSVSSVGSSVFISESPFKSCDTGSSSDFFTIELN